MCFHALATAATPRLLTAAIVTCMRAWMLLTAAMAARMRIESIATHALRAGFGCPTSGLDRQNRPVRVLHHREDVCLHG